MLYREIEACRVCGNRNLETVLKLGSQALTGVFPRADAPDVAEGPLELCFCPECTLVQMKYSYDPTKMFSAAYGYRSGLNQSMVRHLDSKVACLTRLAGLKAGDWVLDIGSNDGTLLGLYKVDGLNRVGMDPTAGTFRSYYDKGIIRIEDFFSGKKYRDAADGHDASLVTSISMFYDLEAPVDFARDIEGILAEDGIWHLEQSYLPAMLRTNSFDTICHEHAEYYSVHSIQAILQRAGLKILNVSFNDINGGSFAVTACKEASNRPVNAPLLTWILTNEERMGLHTSAPVLELGKRIADKTAMLRDLLSRLAHADQRVLGYGASTKGNVTLQYSRITPKLIPAIAEINPDKFGHVTPGTRIPIISEIQAKAMKPDYFLVLPWHFRNDILAREETYLRSGGHFIFPLPEPEVV